MGQEHSSGNSGSGEGGSLSFLQKATGISPKPSSRAGKIIVVNPGVAPNGEETEDQDLKKLNEIPQFLPILRSSLNIPNVKDPPDLFTKFSPRPVLSLCRRLQDHYTATSEIVAAEQGSLGTRVREIDYAIATLMNFVTERQRSHQKCVAELVKIRELNIQLKKVSASLQELVPTVTQLNDCLPESEKLDRLNLEKILDNDKLTSLYPGRGNLDESPGSSAFSPTGNAQLAPEDVEEQKVVDASPSISVSSPQLTAKARTDAASPDSGKGDQNSNRAQNR